MRCLECEGETPDGRLFCEDCGAPLTTVCSDCGAQLGTGKRFCGFCGTPVRARDTPVSSTPAPGGVAHPVRGLVPTNERRLCSVMFIDLVGFTSFAEKRDPEETRELLSLYFERAQAIIANYGGTVEKFIGDAVMAIWGAPVANEDDAERSVRAALDVVASVADLGTKSGVELEARAGIVTGEVAITVGKVSEGMVIGDTVNAASRMQSLAPPGSVLVDETTLRAASRAVVFTEFGELHLRGKEQTVRAWRAARVVAQRRGIGRTERPEPPFVGRDEELRLVKELLHATAREHRARLVSVSGIPGIGKSRLCWELRKYVDGLAETVYWHEGRSPAYGEGITFWALGEMVRMRAGINETEDAASTRPKLNASLAEYVADPEERKWIEPRLAHLLGLGEIPSGDREELFSAWRTFFERVAERRPTVMIFEDLQWADHGLIDFVESILEWSRSPILLVTLSRPELMDRRPNWGAGQRSFTSLHLEPLSGHAMTELLDGLVQDMPTEFADKILERCEGVPLYAVETVRMLADRRVLSLDEAGYHLTGETASLEIPDTLHALIASRLDTLSPDQRALVEDAAVVGRTFTTASLAVVNGGNEAYLSAQLRDLVRREFLLLNTDPRSPERGQYGFVQGLTREVAYATLSRRDRSAKHLTLARHLESFGDDELAAVVAAHYLEARRAAHERADADLIAAGARHWLSRAGERALSLGSPEQALSFLEQALELIGPGADRAALLELAGDAADRTSVCDRALPLLEEALAYYEAIGDTVSVGRATVELAHVLDKLSRLFDAIERCERAFTAVGKDGDDRVRATLACELAYAHNDAGSYQQALEWSEIALALSERLDDPASVGEAIGAKSGALFNLGRHQEAIMLARGRVTLADSTGSLMDQAWARSFLATFLLGDDPREALSAGKQSAELARRAGHRWLEISRMNGAAEGSLFLGEWGDTRTAITELEQRVLPLEQRAFLDCIEATLAALTGDREGASSCLERGASRLSGTELVTGRATYLLDRALVSLAAGDLEAARRESAEAVSADPLGINAPHALAVQARAALWLGDAEGLRAAMAGMKAFRGRWVSAEWLSAEAGLAALEGRVETAADSYREAIEAWRTLNCTLDLALCELDLVVVLGPNHPGATVAREALDVFARIGARPFLERLNRAFPADEAVR
jgi:class 3 adenylate cyclase/tetratricopeptide (TPR) repeat protein